MVKFGLSIKFYHVRYQRITILLDVGKETPNYKHINVQAKDRQININQI